VAPRVHPTAQVAPSAELAGDVEVRAGAVIEAGVRVGAATVVDVGTVLKEGTVVGARCRLGPYAVLGGTPMDRAFAGEPSALVLEDDVDVREFATLSRATGEGAHTLVGAGTLVMAYVHVSHNALVGRRCVLTNLVQLGGHVIVEDEAVLGAGAMVHQHCRIGRLAMVGGAAGVNRDILPFTLARGNIAHHFRLNRVGLLRHGVTGQRYRVLESAFRALRHRDDEALERLAAEHDDVAAIAAFIAGSKRGVSRFQVAS
jgi:UDP-N-acetylglucosamine acyltransferase